MYDDDGGEIAYFSVRWKTRNLV